MTGTSFYSVEKTPGGRSGGTTQAETRIYNERLVLSLIRRHRQLSKVDLTRLTGLAPQTITTIVNRAADGGFLLRLEPLRGRLGQPSMPYSLNPDGAYSFGLKIDHRSADVALINFMGDVLAFERATFDYPTPSDVVAFTRATVAGFLKKHKSIAQDRIAGLGIASTFYQWNWGEEIGIPPARLKAWREIDIRAELDQSFDWPVYLFNDATVAAGAELMFGSGLGLADFLYVYVGYLIGGGLVLDHHLFPGRSNLAASLGRILVPTGDQATARFAPLLEVASIHYLEKQLGDADKRRIWSSPDDWSEVGSSVTEWISLVADGLAHTARTAVTLVDIDNIIIDGAIPAAVRRALAKELRRKLAHVMAARPEPFSVLEGAFGHLAPVMGGASIPLLVRYSNDKDSLFKD